MLLSQCAGVWRIGEAQALQNIIRVAGPTQRQDLVIGQQAQPVTNRHGAAIERVRLRPMRQFLYGLIEARIKRMPAGFMRRQCCSERRGHIRTPQRVEGGVRLCFRFSEDVDQIKADGCSGRNE